MPIHEAGDWNTLKNKIVGCLLGGAVGDALGAAVEFNSSQEIQERFGSCGIRDFASIYGREGAITDDTQMSLFTAEGLMRAQNRWLDRGLCHVPGAIHRAYLRWLLTQSETPKYSELFYDETDDSLLDPGWLYALPALHNRRAPGNSCLSSLKSGVCGSIEEPINNSKGCGGVMRVAPVGLAGKEENVFDLACDAAAITHGHPSGYLAAGILGVVIFHIVSGVHLEEAIFIGLSKTKGLHQSEEIRTAVWRAVDEAKSGQPSLQKIESLGKGWIAEEALAISLYCALVADNFEEGVILAVNHGGDSDSTGAITGNILGAIYGRNEIPERWLIKLELRNEIERVAKDLHRYFRTDKHVLNEEEYERYPPN